MDIAKCTLDGVSYSAERFSQLPPNELSKKRKNLVCPECQAVAFFRKASRNGQPACFAARPHQEGCSLTSTETQAKEDGEEYISISSKKLIEINLAESASFTNSHVNYRDSEKQPIKQKTITKTLDYPSQLQETLSNLLKNLISSDKFKHSSTKITIDHNYTTYVKDFFVILNNVDKNYKDQLYGFWGIFSDARLGNDGSLWLNSGGTSEVSCLIPSEKVDELYSRYNLTDEEDLAGAYILVVSKLAISQYGKPYIKVTDINHLTLRLFNQITRLNDNTFQSETKKLAFFLKKNDKGAFDEELGIKKKHYLNKTEAKLWKAKLLNQFHPDKNIGDNAIDFDEVTRYINKIYNRMVGKA